MSDGFKRIRDEYGRIFIVLPPGELLGPVVANIADQPVSLVDYQVLEDFETSEDDSS